jgi:hypothetical protein
MDTACSQNGQILTHTCYYVIPTSRKQKLRPPTNETSGLLYWDQNGPKGQVPDSKMMMMKSKVPRTDWLQIPCYTVPQFEKSSDCLKVISFDLVFSLC